MISRMVDQKGFDLLDQTWKRCRRWTRRLFCSARASRASRSGGGAWQIVIPRRIGVRIGFDDALAHLIEGGADIFLMPSRFEPCGLNQMYSLRYGTVPVVHATGGLFDTVHDVDEHRKGNRIHLRRLLAGGFARCLGKGLECSRIGPAWRRIQRAGMREDFSWDASAREYVKVYERAVTAGGAGVPWDRRTSSQQRQ